MNTLSTEQKEEFSGLLEEVGKSLDISKTQHDAVVKSYEAVGDWLSRPESELSPYQPVISPQGSFRLGTMVKCVNENDDLDIDLVCELHGKKASWTQKDVKKAVGDRLKANETYKSMLDEEGRRCWTLVYSDTANYHMDVLPSIVSIGYTALAERRFAENEQEGIQKLALSITDKRHPLYFTEADPAKWLISNPFGYSQWFFRQAQLSSIRLFAFNESVNPVPKYTEQKLPLQRIVQIMKRHRDIMFNGSPDKPISVIITTLAARAYKKQANIIDALVDVANEMHSYLEEEYDFRLQKRVKWVRNPVNNAENFADRWIEFPQRQKNFEKWLDQLKLDLAEATGRRGLQNISESLSKAFGKNITQAAVRNYGDKLLAQRTSGTMKMAALTGTLGNTGRATVPQHNPYGANE